MQWAIQPLASFITVSPLSGSLLPSQTASVNVEIGAIANTYPPGNYQGKVRFLNLTNGLGNTTTAVTLIVTSPSGSAKMSVTPLTAVTASGTVGGSFLQI